MPSMYIKWLIFSSDLLNLYPAVHFLSMWLIGIMAIINNKGDNASPWKIPLWIFVSAKLLPPAVNSTLQVFIISSLKFMTSCNIMNILCLFFFFFLFFFFLRRCGTISSAFLYSILATARFFSTCSHLGYFALCKVSLLCIKILSEFFLFVREQSTACKWVVNLFPYLWC